MRAAVKCIWILLFLFSSGLATAQQYLVLQKRGTVKNHKYEVGNNITLQTLKGDFILSGDITRITDSTVSIDSYYEISFADISKVLRTRRFLKKLSNLFFIRGGIAYVSIVGINGIINNDSPLIDEQTLIISASMVAIGFALKPLIVRKLDVTEKWQLKMIDFNNIPDDGI